MPWRPLPNILFAICTYPFHPSSSTDLPLQLGDELYIIEQGGRDGAWYRGYLVAPPSLLAGLTSSKGQALEARVFSGVFPRVCVEIREVLGEVAQYGQDEGFDTDVLRPSHVNGESAAGTTNGPSSQEEASYSTPETAPLRRVSQHLASSQDADTPNHPAYNNRISQRDLVSGGSKPPAPVPMLKIGDETATSQEEPLVDEIASCLREWHSTNLHELLLNRQYDLLEEMSILVSRLDTARRQLLHRILTNHELDKLRNNAIWDLVAGNRVLSGEVIVRSAMNRGRILTFEDSAFEISRLQSMMSLLDQQPDLQVETRPSYHLLVDLKTFTNETETPTILALSLHLTTPDGQPTIVSESYAIDASSRTPSDASVNNGSMRTLFTELNAFDMDQVIHGASQLLLVIKVVTNEPLKAKISQPQQRPVTSDGIISHAADNTNGTVRSPTGRRSFLWPAKDGRESGSNFKPSRQRPSVDMPVLLKTPDFQPNSAANEPSSAKERRFLKRTTGVGVLNISDLVRDKRSSKHELSLWSPTSTDGPPSEQDDAWDGVIAQLLPASLKNYHRSSTVGDLVVHLTPFVNVDCEALIQARPTLLQHVQITQQLSFSGAPTRPRSDIYLTLSEPSLPLNVLLSHPKVGSVPLPNDLVMADLQLTLEVRNASGDRIENCIFPASNSPGHTAWRTTAIERGESWNQTIKLALKPQDVPGSHVVMSLADAGNFPFALCWMPLWAQEAFIRDGDHALSLYKYDEYTSSVISGKGAYLALPWSFKTKDEAVLGPIAALQLRTYLCSTSYSQDPNLLGLLKWREHHSRELGSLLKRFQFVPEIEVVKLLDEAFRALFEILVEYAGNDEIEDLVFDCVVVVLGIVHDRRFNLQPLVDEYIAVRFRYPFAFPCLTRSFVRLLSDPTEPDISRRLRATCKVGCHVLRFIVKARQQQILKEAGIGIKSHSPTFAKDLQNIFAALNALMRKTAPILIGTKTVIVQNFHSWLPELSDVVSSEEIFDMASRFIDSCSEVQGKLILYKLVLINQISSADLFPSSEAQRAWRIRSIGWLEPYWGIPPGPHLQWREQVRLSSSVAATIISRSHGNSSNWTRKLVDSYLAIRASPRPQTGTLSLLFPKAYPFPSRPTRSTQTYDEALIELAALLAATTNQASEFLNLPRSELTQLISDMLRVCNSILDCEAFPSSWLSLHIFHYKAISQILALTSTLLIHNFIPQPELADEFMTEFWMSFFLALLRVVGSDALALETFPEQKRRAVWKIAGDVRDVGAGLLRQTWHAIGWEASLEERTRYDLDRMGGYQVQYVPPLVGPIVELCLSVHEGLRSAAITVLRTMIISEWALSTDLGVLQAEVINRLDRIFKTTLPNDAVLQKLFITELLISFEHLPRSHNKALFSAVKAFTDVLDHLLDLLVAVHSTAITDEASHMMDTLRLMNFLRDMRKEDMYIAYVHELAEIQLSAGQPTEAGLALRMHAELYDWDNSTVVAALQVPALPAQTSFERKEQVYLQMIKYYEKGGAWEHALDAYGELAHEYETNIFDFAKLAQAQRAMATIYENINKGERQNPRYFWVSFRGLGFPSSLRDRQFIWEGLPTDRYGSFADKMQQQYPTAQIIARGPADDLEGQYLSITPVGAQKDLLHPVNRQPKVSQHVREHLMFTQPRHFTTTPRRHASQAGIKDTVVEKVVFTTAESFPTILRRSEIIDSQTVKLSPVQIGLERTIRKTQELQNLESRVLASGDKGFKGLTEALMILIHPESGGCVVEYWDLLPRRETGTPLEEDEETATAQSQLATGLKVALLDHISTIRRCLACYSKPTHHATKADLTKVFEKTFATLLLAFDSPVHQSTDMADTSSSRNVELESKHSTQLNGVSSHPSRDELDTGAGARELEQAVASPATPTQALSSAIGGSERVVEESSKGQDRKSQHENITVQATETGVRKGLWVPIDNYLTPPNVPTGGEAERPSSNNL